MPNVNVAIIAGHLTRDPEVRGQNNDVTTFCIAVNRYRKDKEDEVSFIDVVCFKQTASFVIQYLRKGDAVLVEGSLSQQRWEDKEGNKKSKVEIIAKSVQSLKRKSDGGSGNGGRQQEAPF